MAELPPPLLETRIDAFPLWRKGKVRDVYDLGDRLLIVATDRISAFDVVLPNHDGEDSDNWDAFYYPLGDARVSLDAFVALLKGEMPGHAENWEPGLLP